MRPTGGGGERREAGGDWLEKSERTMVAEAGDDDHSDVAGEVTQAALSG